MRYFTPLGQEKSDVVEPATEDWGKYHSIFSDESLSTLGQENCDVVEPAAEDWGNTIQYFLMNHCKPWARKNAMWLSQPLRTGKLLYDVIF